MRTVTIGLSSDQQLQLGPQIVRLASLALGLEEKDAGPIFVEVMAKLTPAQTASEIAIAKVVSGEIEAYRADPTAYQRRVKETQYGVIATSPDAPKEVGRLPAEIENVVSQNPPVPRGQDDWIEFAQSIDGYAIFRELDLESHEHYSLMRERYERRGEWRGSYLDLRLVLFMAARDMHHSECAFGLSSEDPRFEVALQALLTSITEAKGLLAAKKGP